MQIQLMMEIVQFLTIFGAPSANLNYLRLVHPHQHIKKRFLGGPAGASSFAQGGLVNTTPGVKLIQLGWQRSPNLAGLVAEIPDF